MSKDNADYEKFKNWAARIFNAGGLWSCEYCYWIDCDDRICKVCKMMMKELHHE